MWTTTCCCTTSPARISRAKRKATCTRNGAIRGIHQRNIHLLAVRAMSRCGMPLGDEGFAGNRHDATTLEEIVAHMEELYGRDGGVRMQGRALPSRKKGRFLRGG